MQLTITVPDNFDKLPESEQIRCFFKGIKDISQYKPEERKPLSKGERIAARFRREGFLTGKSEQVNKLIREFRDDFSL